MSEPDIDNPGDPAAAEAAAAGSEPRASEPAVEEGTAAPEPARGSRFSDPWFRFAASFGVLALTAEVVYYAVLVDSPWLKGYLQALAATSGWILERLQLEVRVTRAVVSSGGFSVQIAHGCDAIQICALLSCAILAFPAAWSRKLIGLGAGILWLQLLNQVRIVSLVLIGIHFEDFFKSAHLQVWPSLLIVITVVTWIVWVRWATRDDEFEPAPA